MPLATLNIPPYHDDFFANNVDGKNYIRILFRGGRAVQARELTQLQTAIQSQIDRFGQSIYKEGTAVIDGLASIDNFCSWVKVASFYTGVTADSLLGARVYSDSGPSAQIIGHKIISGTTYLFLKYIGADAATGLISSFTASSVLKLISNASTVATIDSTSYTGNGTRFSINSGVYFIAGNFISVETTNIFELTNNLTGQLFLTVTENVVTATDDNTLYDNAAGSSNYAAPGADRYQIILGLNFIDSVTLAAETTSPHRTHLLTVEDGRVHTLARTEYSNLERTLAQRTFEESGNYTVRPFQLDVREHLDNGTNRGYKTLANGGDESKLAITIEPSVAYVDGYRVELADKKIISINKARNTSEFFDIAQSLSLGNYLYGKFLVTSQAGLDISQIDRVYDIKNSGGTIIGNCRIRLVKRASALYSTYQFFLSDINMTGGNLFSSARSFVYSSSVAITITDIDGNILAGGSAATLYDSSSVKLLFSLPFDAVKTFKPILDIRYQTIRRYMFTPLTSATFVTLSESLNNTIESTSTSDYFITNGNNLLTETDFSISGTSSSRIINFVAPKSGTVTVFAVVTKVHTAADSTSKTLSTTSTDITVTGGVLQARTMTNGVSTIGGLNQEDVFEITSISHSTAGDVTSKYKLYSGQTDEFYCQSYISLKTGETSPVNGTLTVTFKYFTHGSTGDYFNVDSYPTATIGYNAIPSYSGVRLSNTIDFRKKKSLLTSQDQLNAGCTFAAQLSQYLSRIDKVVVSASSEFKVIAGNPAMSPSEPVTPDGHMALHTLVIPAYTFDVKDVIVTFIDNKRYTMRDIGAIDARVRNLEYYTSLSLLEKETTSLDIGARYKNGILVDSFVGHNVGDITNKDYSCAIDSNAKQLRPKASVNNLRLTHSSIVGDAVIVNGLAMKGYYEVDHISQRLASSAENVNPYNVFSWIGSTKLSPSSDEWKDMVRRPDVVINQDGTYDAVVALAESQGVLGTHWNEWTTNWVGKPVKTTTKSALHALKAPDGKLRQKTTVITTRTEQSGRNGSVTTVTPDTVVTPMGDKVVDSSIVPFIRSRKVYFKGEQLKPNTRVYLYFDGSDITAYCTQGSSGDFDANQFYNSTHEVIANESFPYSEVGAGGIGGTSSGVLQTNQNGVIEGYFVIPNNSKLRFRTGERTVRIIDNANDLTTTGTYAEGVYTAAGVINTVQATSISTRVPRFTTTAVSESKTSVITDSTKVTWGDPLAQSFIIGDIPGGIFITSVDLFFKAKDVSIPVSVHIVSCENGIPTQKVIPFSKVTLYPSSVAISNNSTTATKFTFDSPVHLSDGIEYAMVVTSNSDSYLMWVAEIGQTDVASGNRITANPYAGVMFKSQNSSTWTPDQTKDFKFVMRRAQFNAGSTGVVNFNELVPSGTSFSYSLINTIAQQLYFPGAGVNWTLTLADEGGLIRTLDINENLDLERIRSITYPLGASNIKVSATISSTGYLSGIVDLDRISMIFVNNIVNNSSSGETSSSGGSALAKYITRPVVLNNSADRLHIYLALNRPQYTDIKVYVKTTINPDLLVSTSWVEITPYKSIPISSDIEDYTEVQFIAGDDLGEVVGSFTTFTVKIVMLSDTASTSAVPTIKDFRCIASL